MQNAEQDSLNDPAPGPPEKSISSKSSSFSLGGLRAGAILILALIIAGVFGTGLFAGWQFGSNNARSSQVSTTDSSLPGLNGSDSDPVREAVITKTRPTVVQVDVVTDQGRGLGSGVIIDKRGYIITNYHVIQKANMIDVVLYNGQVLPARLTGSDPPDDLAVLQIIPGQTALTIAALGDSSKLKVGQAVLAIGNPLGITQTVTSGIVSALQRNVSTIPDAIQTDAPINPGNSGGALVDMQGALIGIPSSVAIDPEFKTPANGVGFAIPSNRVAFIAPQIIQTGKVTNSGRASLGVKVTDVDPTLAAQNGLATNSGALIVAVVPGGPADKAGLTPGDVIVQIDKAQITGIASLSDTLVSRKPGDTVAVSVYRGNRQLTFKVKLGELQIPQG
ncbi:MAG: S1C family serine protease [Ktedonobacteraceae bacterium]